MKAVTFVFVLQLLYIRFRVLGGGKKPRPQEPQRPHDTGESWSYHFLATPLNRHVCFVAGTVSETPELFAWPFYTDYLHVWRVSTAVGAPRTQITRRCRGWIKTQNPTRWFNFETNFNSVRVPGFTSAILSALCYVYTSADLTVVFLKDNSFFLWETNQNVSGWRSPFCCSENSLSYSIWAQWLESCKSAERPDVLAKSSSFQSQISRKTHSRFRIYPWGWQNCSKNILVSGQNTEFNQNLETKKQEVIDERRESARCGRW